MKVRDISLMITGAIITIAVIVSVSTFFNPTKAQAQAIAAAPGAVATIVSAYAQGFTGSSYFQGGGIITVNDPNTRKVTIVAYQSSVTATNGVPTFTLSSTNSFTY